MDNVIIDNRPLTSEGKIRDLLRSHGFNFSKSLGQNFLINPSVCPKMVDASEAGENVGVLEIGPGIGVLTKELASRGGEVVAVELDKKLLPILDKTLSDFNNIKIINDDFMKLDLKQLLETEFKSKDIAVCANLPYYITSPIVMHLLESRVNIDSITVMVQKEAALRLCAAQGTRESGAVTLAVWYYSVPEILFNVSRGSFMPAPNVDSSVIKLKVRKKPPVDVYDEKTMFRLIKSGFGQRRKTLANSLMTAGLTKQETNELLDKSKIKRNARAEELSLKEWATLSNSLTDG